ncbi:30S ribosomal protein S14 [bacterium]|jgi:small subunit ribosomal protein S14|nr:30S ribosomal protein S14 [bacterium]NBW56426.1 30S ribosomal protein S14 [bacterium]NBX71705.1 30S ribosomal protein S14 [bacterium]
MVATQKKTQKNRWVRRNNKREVLINKHYEQRQALKKELVDAAGDLEKQFDILAKIEKLPKDSSYVRARNRCPINGRPRGTYRKVGVCRALFRNWVMEGYLPGFVMSSW